MSLIVAGFLITRGTNAQFEEGAGTLRHRACSCRVKRAETSTHKSTVTHAGKIFVPRDRGRKLRGMGGRVPAEFGVGTLMQIVPLDFAMLQNF